MDDTDGRDHSDLDGLSLSDAVAAVDDDATDDETVRETLAIVADDGVVARSAVDDAVGNASQVLTTVETRVELAAAALADARESAEPVSELDIVTARLDDFAAELDLLEERTTEVGERLQRVVDRTSDGDLYDLARDIRRVTETATELQRAADDLQLELEEFEQWLDSPARRHEELTEDVGALDESLADLEAVVDGIAADEAAADEDGDAAEGADSGDRDAATVWADATVRHRVTDLLLADLRSELSTLAEWADREGAAPPTDAERRLDEVATRHDTLGRRLVDLAEPAWQTRHGDSLAAVNDALDGMEPPVAWGEVEAIVEEHAPTDE